MPGPVPRTAAIDFASRGVAVPCQAVVDRVHRLARFRGIRELTDWAEATAVKLVQRHLTATVLDQHEAVTDHRALQRQIVEAHLAGDLLVDRHQLARTFLVVRSHQTKTGHDAYYTRV